MEAKEKKIVDYKKSIDPLTEQAPEIHRPTFKLSQTVPSVSVSLHCCVVFIYLMPQLTLSPPSLQESFNKYGMISKIIS